MYIESVPNRNSPPAILLRESYRDGEKVKKRTIANLSDWPSDLVEGLRTLLKGGTATPADRQSIIVLRALPHGHVAAVLGTLRDIGLDRVLGRAGNRPRDLVIAMIVARLIAPASKLATARMLDPATATSSLGDVLGLGAVDEDELYAAIDWLGERQQAIETTLARKHLRDGTLVLYPGERLIVCRNPDLARERTRKRLDLLAATEDDLAAIAAAASRARKPLRGKAEIALKVGAVVNRHKMAKHFELDIGEASFAFHRNADAIAAEAALDGIYVVRTNLAKRMLDDAATVGAYKSLAKVERAFRSLKTVDIHLRPIFHWTAPRVRAHVLLCMLAYHVEHHMRARIAPMLFDETDHEAAAAMRASIVAKAERSDAAIRKQTTGRTDDGLPVHSFQTLLADLATYCRIQATTALNEKYVFTLHTRPTQTQQRAFELLGINPDRTQ